MAEGIIQYSKEIIDDLKITTNTTYSSDKIEKLLASIPNGNTTEVILGCFDSTNVPTAFVQDDQYYNTTDRKIYKATSSTVWDAGTTPKEDVLYASIADNKIYAYIKNVWSVYGGNTTKISAKTNNIVSDLQGQTNANEDGLYVPLSKKSGNVIDNLTGQATDVNNGLFVGKSAKTDNALQKLTGNTNPSEDGLYVEDLNPKINRLDLTTKLNKYGTQEYFYLTGKQNKSTATGSVNGFIDNKSSVHLSAGKTYDVLYLLKDETLKTTIDDTTRYDFTQNGTTNTTGSYIILKAGITYKIKCGVLSTGTGSLFIIDENGDCISNRGYNGVTSYSDIGMEAIAKYNKDTKIYVKYACNVPTNTNTDIIIYPSCSYFIVETMEYLAIDPLQYVDTNNGTQDTPVGTIISLMGKTAPKHYLICDGTEYQIKDYPHLAEYFKKEFGTVNHFGGDGTTTFKVPDLKGEFLRGTGTNSHVNQGNGATVGTHQDATEIPFTYTWGNTFGMLVNTNSTNSFNGNPTKWDSSVKEEHYYQQNSTVTTPQTSTNPATFTTRPTNTSVLYCIKAEPTYFINVIGTTTETELLDTPVEVDLPTGTDLTLMINNDVTLNDKITNYDKIQVKLGVIIDTNSNILNRKTNVIDIDDISYTSVIGADNYIYDVVNPAPTGVHMTSLFYSFKDDETLTLIRTGYYCTGTKSWQKIKLLSVKGIKTSSVVQGGNFGGSGSSNPDCDCGTLTPAQIATAITDSGTELDK